MLLCKLLGKIQKHHVPQPTDIRTADQFPHAEGPALHSSSVCFLCVPETPWSRKHCLLGVRNTTTNQMDSGEYGRLRSQRLKHSISWLFVGMAVCPHSSELQNPGQNPHQVTAVPSALPQSSREARSLHSTAS